jgi:hypothetical protein
VEASRCSLRRGPGSFRPSFTKRAEAETSLMARNIFRAAVKRATEGVGE